MRTPPILFSLIFFVFAVSAWGQPADALVRDLRGEWMLQEPNGYRKYSEEDVRTVHLNLNSQTVKGSWLRISSSEPFGIFINQQLAEDRAEGAVVWRVDSLAAVYPGMLRISIFQPGGVRFLSTELLSLQPESAQETLIPRAGNFFLDFAFLSLLLVSIYLVFLMANNPKLTIDYLNALKLFSVQEREENLLTNRVTSRINLLFYLFCCLFCSLILLIIFRMSSGRIPLAADYPIHSTGQGFLQWLRLSAEIAVILFLKMILVFVFSELFGLKEAAALQYFHFIRALLVGAGLIALISLLNFIFKGSSPGFYLTLLKLGAAVLVLSAVMMQLKLMALTRYHFFHLFSYLCASEIIPLLILLKVLLY